MGLEHSSRVNLGFLLHIHFFFYSLGLSGATYGQKCQKIPLKRLEKAQIALNCCMILIFRAEYFIITQDKAQSFNIINFKNSILQHMQNIPFTNPTKYEFFFKDPKQVIIETFSVFGQHDLIILSSFDCCIILNFEIL